jgi:hypothetical protein
MMGLALSLPTMKPLMAPIRLPASTAPAMLAARPSGSSCTAMIPEKAMMQGTDMSTKCPE